MRRWEVWKTHQESARDGRERVIAWWFENGSGVKGLSFSKKEEASFAGTTGRAPEEK